MDIFYPYAQLIHLLLAIIFLGYIFFDVVIFKTINYKFDSNLVQKIKSTISQKAIKIMPLSLLFIILTGGAMMSSYVGSKLGWFETSFQKLFMIKITLALLIVCGVILNLSRKIMGKKTLPFMKNFHLFALICGFFIVVLAKLMFVL